MCGEPPSSDTAVEGEIRSSQRRVSVETVHITSQVRLCSLSCKVRKQDEVIGKEATRRLAETDQVRSLDSGIAGK